MDKLVIILFGNVIKYYKDMNLVRQYAIFLQAQVMET